MLLLTIEYNLLELVEFDNTFDNFLNQNDWITRVVQKLLQLSQYLFAMLLTTFEYNLVESV